MTENEIGPRLIEAAIAVHRELGPGLLETVYEVVLARELADRGLKVVRQTPVPITYKGIQFDEGFRADLIVEDRDHPLCEWTGGATSAPQRLCGRRNQSSNHKLMRPDTAA